jgi:hypothetical protein
MARIDRSSEALGAPPSDEFLFDRTSSHTRNMVDWILNLDAADVLDALNHIAPVAIAPAALHRSDWDNATTVPCTHPFKYETSSSHSTASSSHGSPQAAWDGTYVPSPSPEYVALPMNLITQIGGYSRQRHSKKCPAYPVGSVDHHAARQTLPNQISDNHMLSYLERITLAPRLRGRGARGGAAGYICRWPGCNWPQFSRRDHAKNHIAAHMNLRPHGCTKWYATDSSQ